MKPIMITLLFLVAISCTKETYVEGLNNNQQSNSNSKGNTTDIINQGNFTIKNNWKGTFLSVKSGQAVCTSTSYKWVRLNIRGTEQYYIKDRATGLYLSNGTNGQVILSNNQDEKSTWTLTQVFTFDTTIVRIQSDNKTGNYLNIESGPIICSPIKTGWISAQWTVSN